MRRGNTVLIVLPLKVPGDTGDDAVIAQGLLEDVTGELSRFATLQVMAWSSGVALAGLSDTEIRDRVGVTHVLRGSLRRVDERLRIAVDPVECEGGTQLWKRALRRPRRGALRRAGRDGRADRCDAGGATGGERRPTGSATTGQLARGL